MYICRVPCNSMVNYDQNVSHSSYQQIHFRCSASVDLSNDLSLRNINYIYDNAQSIVSGMIRICCLFKDTNATICDVYFISSLFQYFGCYTNISIRNPDLPSKSVSTLPSFKKQEISGHFQHGAAEMSSHHSYTARAMKIP